MTPKMKRLLTLRFVFLISAYLFVSPAPVAAWEGCACICIGEEGWCSDYYEGLTCWTSESCQTECYYYCAMREMQLKDFCYCVSW